jgi:hypothetical protein
MKIINLYKILIGFNSDEIYFACYYYYLVVLKSIYLITLITNKIIDIIIGIPVFLRILASIYTKEKFPFEGY